MRKYQHLIREKNASKILKVNATNATMRQNGYKRHQDWITAVAFKCDTNATNATKWL